MDKSQFQDSVRETVSKIGEIGEKVSPKIRKGAAVVAGVALTLTMGGCGSEKPDGVIKDASTVCIEDGARKRDGTQIPDHYDAGSRVVATLDIDGNPAKDSGESVCYPVDSEVSYIDHSLSYQNGRWIEVKEDDVIAAAESNKITLPDGHVAPEFLKKGLVDFAKKGHDGWTNEVRIEVRGKHGENLTYKD